MKQKVHREKFMFEWFTINHKIVVGFEHVKHGRCSKCGKTIATGSTLCDDCFKKEKKISRK